MVLAYVVVFTGLAWDFHAGMRTHKADLGQIDQAVWNSSQGRFLEFTERDATSVRLTDHVEPIFVLISPIYWLWNDVRALLLLQVLAVASGAFFVYALALEKLDQLLTPAQRTKIWHWEPLQQLTRPVALALAAAYLLAPPLQSAILTEVHAVPFGVPLILWAFWAVERRKWTQFILAALLVAAVKEEMALLAAALGIWAMWRAVAMDDAQWTIHNGAQGPTRTTHHAIKNFQFSILNSKFSILPGLLVTLLALAWFVIATFVIVPHYAAGWYDVAESSYFQRYGALGNSPVDIFKSFFTQPGLVLSISLEPARLDYILGLLAAFGFFSLLAPEILLLCLPVLLANSLSAFPAQYYSQFHYDAPIVPFVAVSAIYGAARLWRFVARRITASSASFQHIPAASPAKMALMAFASNAGSTVRPLLAMGLILWTLAWAGGVYAQSGRGPGGGGHEITPVTAHDRLITRFTAQIPVDAPVSATAAVHPHVSHRQHIYQFPRGLDAPANPATWALIDVTTNTDMAPGDVKASVDALLAADWGIVDAADGFLLLAKDAPTKTIPDPFYDFARARSPIPDPRSLISFGPLSAIGIETEDWPRWRQTKVTTLWQVADDYVPGSVRPWLEIRTPNGEIVHTFDQVAPRPDLVSPRPLAARRNHPPHHPLALPAPHLGRSRCRRPRPRPDSDSGSPARGRCVLFGILFFWKRSQSRCGQCRWNHGPSSQPKVGGNRAISVLLTPLPLQSKSPPPPSALAPATPSPCALAWTMMSCAPASPWTCS